MRSTIFKTERFVTAEVSVLARLSAYDNLFISAARIKQVSVDVVRVEI